MGSGGDSCKVCVKFKICVKSLMQMLGNTSLLVVDMYVGILSIRKVAVWTGFTESYLRLAIDNQRKKKENYLSAQGSPNLNWICDLTFV